MRCMMTMIGTDSTARRDAIVSLYLLFTAAAHHLRICVIRLDRIVNYESSGKSLLHVTSTKPVTWPADDVAYTPPPCSVHHIALESASSFRLMGHIAWNDVDLTIPRAVELFSNASE